MTKFVLRFIFAIPLLLGNTSNVGAQPVENRAQPNRYYEDDDKEVLDEVLPVFLVPDGVGKIGYARFWFFGAKDMPAVDLVVLPLRGELPDGQGANFVGQGLQNGSVGNYLPFGPGSWQLYIIPNQNTDGVTPIVLDAEVLQKLSLLDGALKFNVPANSFQTVIVRSSATTLGKLTMEILNDSDRAQFAGKLRVFNFTASSDVNVGFMKNGHLAPLIRGPIADRKDAVLPAVLGSQAFEVDFPLKKEFRGRRSIEMNVGNSISSSLILHYDRYGRMAVGFTNDAPKSLTP